VVEVLTEQRFPTNQRWVAKKLNLSQPAVALWNKPGGYPTLDNALELAKLLNVCVEWILTERGPKRPVPGDSWAEQMWAMWPHLTEGDRRELAVRAEGFLRRRREEQDESYPATGTSLTNL
jgi:hypothetical protein